MAPTKSNSMAKAVDRFAADWDKSFGPGTLQMGRAIKPYSIIPTGSVALDVAVGVGGYVKGRINEIWGPDGIGKTFLCLCAIRQAQLIDPELFQAVIDAENKMADSWMHAFEIDRARIMKYVPVTAEQAADAARKFLSYDGLFNMVVLDSIGALIAKADLEAQADKASMTQVARIVTRMMGVMTGFAQQRQVAVILVNQLRDNVSTGAVQRFKTYARAGGWKLKYSTTFGFQVGGASKAPIMVDIKGTKHVAAREVSVRVKRNKVYAEGPVVNIMLNTVDSDHGKVGIDQAEEVFVLGPKLGVIKKDGALYTLPGGKWFRGEHNLKEHLHANPAVVADLRLALLELNAPAVLATSDDEEEVEFVEGPEEAEQPSHALDRAVFMAAAMPEAPRSPQEPTSPVLAPITASEASEVSEGEWEAPVEVE